MHFKILMLTSLSLLSTISANTLDIRTLESNFTQTVTNDQNSKIVYTGKMYATSAKNLALWEYNSPIEKKIYYKGGNELVIIEPELEQVIYAKLGKVPNVLKLFKSAKKISAHQLQTKFNGLTYNINTNGNKIDTISYTDEMQNSVVIHFTQEKVNQTISAQRFAYTIPADYDVLEQ